MSGIPWVCVALLVTGCSAKQAAPESPAVRTTPAATPPPKGRAVSSPSQTEGTPGEWSGTVKVGLMAIGGETTGIVLTTDTVVYELRATGAELDALADSNGQRVTIKGRLREISGIELRKRRIIDVQAIVRP